MCGPSCGVVHDVDFIAASFVRKGADVRKIREVLAAAGGKSIRIISKVENHEGGALGILSFHLIWRHSITRIRSGHLTI